MGYLIGNLKTPLLPPTPAGRHEFASQQANGGYNFQGESSNWYFAIGGYATWGKGVAVVQDVAGGQQCDVDFEYKFFDRYNWDGGKSVTIAGI